MARYLLNSAVITAPGTYRYRLVSREEASRWMAEGDYTSAIGYEQTAEALAKISGLPVPVNRVTVKMEPGDEALVFRIALPEGHPRIDPKDKGALENVLREGYYELGVLERLA